MKKLALFILALLALGCILTLVKSNASAKQDAKDDTSTDADERVPKYEETVQAVEPDNFYFDTVVMVNDEALGYGFSDNEEKYGLRFLDRLLEYDPTAHIDKVSGDEFAVDLVGRRKVFDATSPSCVDEIEAFLSPIKGFKRFDDKYLENIYDSTQETVCYFTLDYPDASVAGRDDIMEWLVAIPQTNKSMDVNASWYSSLYSGFLESVGKGFDAAQLGQYVAREYFDRVRCEYADVIPPGAYLTIDYRARVFNDRFVTYRSYVHYHEWAGHGMMTEYLHSYDRKNKKAIDLDYLLLPGTYGDVERLLCEAIAADSSYTSNKNLEPTAEGVRRWMDWWGEKGDDGDSGRHMWLPQPAITDTGIVFSFQPYEIDSFGAGSWHFTIPFSAIKPYLTPQAIALLAL